MGQLMIIDETGFARAVQDAITHAKCAIPGESTRAFNDATERIIAAAKEYAPIYVQEQQEAATASGAAACGGPCCTGGVSNDG
jgi:hypothetical protein